MGSYDFKICVLNRDVRRKRGFRGEFDEFGFGYVKFILFNDIWGINSFYEN